MPKVPYPANDQNINTIPQDDYKFDDSYMQSERYQEPCPVDINQNFEIYDGDDDDHDHHHHHRRHSSPHRTADLRNYYIPGKYRTSSPSRRRSRRDDHERERRNDGFCTSRTSTPHWREYGNAERYRSPDTGTAYRSQRRGHGYHNPVRAYPRRSDMRQPSPHGYAILAPPAYGSQQHYMAIQGHQPIQDNSQFYQNHSQGTLVGTDMVSVPGYAVQPTGNLMGVIPQSQAHLAVPATLQGSQSVPLAAIPIAQDRFVTDITILFANE